MLAACLLLGVIAIYAVPNLFTPAFQNSDYPDAGIENSSLDGEPSGYSPTHEKQPTDGIEIGEQDPAAQAQKIEDLPGVPDPDEGNLVEADTVISSYGGMEACYKTPDKDSCIYSIPLQDAMKEYGDTVLYKVVVDVFSDDSILEGNDEAIRNEIERLSEIEYTVELEHRMNGSMDCYYLVLQATQEQLVNFVKKENYGYMFWLYEERISD